MQETWVQQSRSMKNIWSNAISQDTREPLSGPYLLLLSILLPLLETSPWVGKRNTGWDSVCPTAVSPPAASLWNQTSHVFPKYSGRKAQDTVSPQRRGIRKKRWHVPSKSKPQGFFFKLANLGISLFCLILSQIRCPMPKRLPYLLTLCVDSGCV